jgi:hypothetical protein
MLRALPDSPDPDGGTAGAAMDDRLGKLRLAFPAEVTGAFLAAQKILNGPKDINAQNYDVAMALFLAALLLANLVIYFYFYKIRSPFFLLYVSLGFALWAITIDSRRLGDLLPFSFDPTLPLMLLLYNLVAIYIPLPKLSEPPAENKTAK